jgi:hypothetical protein
LQRQAVATLKFNPLQGINLWGWCKSTEAKPIKSAHQSKLNCGANRTKTKHESGKQSGKLFQEAKNLLSRKKNFPFVFKVVRVEGLEPPRLAAPEPKAYDVIKISDT